MSIIYDVYEVEIEFIEDLLGTTPKDPSVYKAYIETKKPKKVEDEDESINVEKIEEKGWTGFMKDPDKDELFIFNYLVKGFLKNAGNILKDQLKIKNLRSKIVNHVFVLPRKIYLGQAEADSVLERPLQAMTMQGPRVSLSRSDAIKAGKRISFQIYILKGSEIEEKTLETIFEYGKVQGIGQFRTGGYGSFKVVSFKKV